MARRAPLVALTASNHVDRGRSVVFLYSNYVAALEYAGVAAVLLTPDHSVASVRSIMEAVDGLVLSGGEDVDPVHYGETARVELDGPYAERDAMELEVVRCALRRQIPLLAICRGQQLLNVAMGGTLFQDIPSDVPDAIGHAQSGGWERRAHDVFVESGSLLHRIARSRTLHINSFHHQAVRDVAPGLRVTARSEDGIVEALEAEGHPWLLGVQWHPERLEAGQSDHDPDRLIFAAFGAAVHGDVPAAAPSQ